MDMRRCQVCHKGGTVFVVNGVAAHKKCRGKAVTEPTVAYTPHELMHMAHRMSQSYAYEQREGALRTGGTVGTGALLFHLAKLAEHVAESDAYRIERAARILLAKLPDDPRFNKEAQALRAALGQQVTR